MLTNATQVSKDLRERLEAICQANGYVTELKRVYGPTDRPRDEAPLPYALVRPRLDTRADRAGVQALRVRSFDIEVVFKITAGEEDLNAVHVDVLRALGFGQDQPERKFPGLIEDEDEATPVFAQDGRGTHSIIISIGVMYAQRYD